MKSRIIFHKSVFPAVPCHNGMALSPLIVRGTATAGHPNVFRRG